MEFDCVMVWTTIGSSTDARKLASTIVEERLAACVNVLSDVESIYRWKEQVETEREHQIIMKTTLHRLPALKARVHELHAYELPEFISLPIVGGSDAYLQWIRESVGG